MKLSLTRYKSILFVQYLFLLCDLVLNTFGEFLRFESVILLVVFVIQDVCLIFSLIIVFLSFFSTYVFQAGLVGVLVKQFRTSILVSLTYLGLSIAFHTWSLHVRWDKPMSYWWTKELVALFIVQRVAAPVYYYYYKRTALTISNPKFYEEASWYRD